MNPGVGPLRIARGSVLAIACTLLAVAAHVGAGGDLPPLPGLLATGAVLGSVFAVLADKERDLRQLAAAAVASQLLFHAVFVLICRVGHPSLLPELGVLATHLAASAGVAVLAWRLDALLWSLVDLLGLAWLPSLLVVPIGSVGPLRPPLWRHAVRSSRPYGSAHPRRGPPSCR